MTGTAAGHGRALPLSMAIAAMPSRRRLLAWTAWGRLRNWQRDRMPAQTPAMAPCCGREGGEQAWAAWYRSRLQRCDPMPASAAHRREEALSGPGFLSLAVRAGETAETARFAGRPACDATLPQDEHGRGPMTPTLLTDSWRKDVPGCRRRSGRGRHPARCG